MPPKVSPLARLFFGKTDARAQAVRQTLLLALETRADFHMDCFVHKRVAYQLKGACAELRPDAIKVYLRGDNEHLPPPGMQIHVYFSLRIDRKSMPFDFPAEIRSTEREGRDAFLWLSMPPELGHNQRRYNVRVPVCKDDISNFTLWYGKARGGKDGKAAGYEWVPISREDVEVMDLSAGGIQLGLSPSSPVYPLLSAKEVLLVRGTFELRDKPSQHLAMMGTVVRMNRPEEHGWASLGIRFRRWGALSDGRFVWRDLNVQEGITPLGAWVFQLILSRRRLEREGREPGRSGSGKDKGQDDHDEQ